MDGDVPLYETVVSAVSNAVGCPPELLPPIAARFDPEALDSLFTSGHAPELRVEFRYAGCLVGVESGGRVTVLSEEGWD